MKEEGLNELHESFKNMKYIKGLEDVIEDIDTVQDMIDRKEYIKDLVVEIESRYSIEIAFFINLENKNDKKLHNENENFGIQVLLDLRNLLYKIGIYKILKEKNIEITNNIITDNYSDMLKLIKEN